MANKLTAAALLILLSIPFIAIAESGHGPDSHQVMKMPSIEASADGIQATFTVVSNEYHNE